VTYQARDKVIVTTINNGTAIRRKSRVEVWGGVLIQPSVIGDGWWLVERIGKGQRGKGELNTVPESEMTRPKGR
jgi:hypothetical protein